MRFVPVMCALAAFSAADAVAQQQGGFAVLRRGDTVAVERYERSDPTWKGTLEIRKQPRPQLEVWSVVRGPERGIALMEVTEKEPPVDDKHKPRVIQEARLIFKDDSVAIDAVTNGGLMTRLYATQSGAMPYLNLSFATIELTLDEARKRSPSGNGPVTVPLFALAGGRTAESRVTFGTGTAVLQVGDVKVECVLLADGRIGSAVIASQELRAERLP